MDFESAQGQLQLPELSLFSDEPPEALRPARPAKKGSSRLRVAKPLPPFDENQLAAAKRIAATTDSKDTLVPGELGVEKAGDGAGGPRPVLYVDAVAGAGKTTVVMGALGEMGRHSDLLLTTFGTAPTKQLERRARQHHPDLVVNKQLVIRAKTINSLGLSLLTANLNLVQYGNEEDGKVPEPPKLAGVERELRTLLLDSLKYIRLAEKAAEVAEVKALLPVLQGERGSESNPRPFVELVELCFANLLKHPGPGDVAKVISDYRLNLADGAPSDEQLRALCKALERIQRQGSEMLSTETKVERVDGGEDFYAGCASFSDQLWIPFYWNLKPRDHIKARAVIVDEYQDLSCAQLGVINRYMHPDTPLVMVGDRRQAIFGFNGAGGRAFQLMAQHFPGDRVELNDSYRCPESHLAIARHYNPKVRRAAAAGPDPIGSGAFLIGPDDMLAELKAGDVVLGRANAALLAAGLKFALRSGFDPKTGKPLGCRIVVKGLAGALLRTIDEVSSAWRKATGAKRINFRTQFLEAMQAYAATLPPSANPDDLALLKLLYEYAHDRPEGATREKFASHCARIFTCDEPLQDGSKVVQFRSVHSMKGDEADRVFVVGLGFGPAAPFWADMSELQKQEEHNISYVALTRSRRELYLVEGFHSSMQVAPDLVRFPVPRPEG